MNEKYIKLIGVAVVVILLAVGGWYGYQVWQDSQEMNHWRELAKGKEQGENLLKEIERLQGELRDDNPNNDAYAYAYIGVAANNLGDKQGALKFYQKALKVDAKHRVALNNTAQIYEDLGEWGKAEEYYRKLIVADPTFTPAYRLLAYLYQYRFNNPEEKIKELIDDGLAATGDSADLLSWIIAYYQENGQTEKSVPYGERLTKQLNAPKQLEAGINVDVK